MDRTFRFRQNKPDEYGTITLDKIKFGLKNKVGGSVISSIKLDRFTDIVADEMVYTLTGFILGKNDIATVEYYATWWQEIRLNVLPKWWLKRFPSLKKRINFKATYPTINLACERHRPYITFITENFKEGLEDE
jgi:hypothetical protein